MPKITWAKSVGKPKKGESLWYRAPWNHQQGRGIPERVIVCGVGLYTLRVCRPSATSRIFSCPRNEFTTEEQMYSHILRADLFAFIVDIMDNTENVSMEQLQAIAKILKPSAEAKCKRA